MIIEYWKIVTRTSWLLAASVFIWGGAGANRGHAQSDGIAFFETKIRPVLVEHCYRCHSAEAQNNKKLKGDLLLDTRDSMRKGGVTGSSIVPGKVDESLLIKALHHKGDVKMPPKGKLPSNVIADFEAWVAMGAPDPRDGIVVAKSKIDYEKGKQHWAFQPVKRVPTPSVNENSWPHSDIDRFILAKLEAKSLSHAKAADKRTLVRRATFDLIGLPPTPEEVDAFLADESPQAFAKVVDRLLDSPHYGERWGRHWLDVIRYADSSGRVSEFREIWRYRDWVTKAFNEDLPYTDFLRMQLVGDLLQPTDPKQINADALVATGMLAIAQFDPGSLWPQMQADLVDDLVDVTSRSMMGLTLACARCHDHKFDPISQEEYYGMAGIFYNIRVVGRMAPDPPRVTVPLVCPDEVAKYNAEKKERQKAKDKRPVPPLPTGVIVKEGPHDPERGIGDMPMYLRGDPFKPGKIVPRGFPRVLSDGSEPQITSGSGRMELARWLTRAEHPLTARVMVNRIWQHLFGAGLVRTPNNFGHSGEKATHPELLDYLADYFVRTGWSIKAIHRRIMLSATYQQSSIADAAVLAADPQNHFWGRANRRRLEAEGLRDSLLAVAGTLDRTIGGPGFNDFKQPRRTHYYMMYRSATTPNSFNVLFERPDPSLIADQRSESILSTQALFMMNDPFVLAQAKALASRVEKEAGSDKTNQQIDFVYRLLFGRPPSPAEVDIGNQLLRRPATPDGSPLERYCHTLLCTNEFAYTD